MKLDLLGGGEKKKTGRRRSVLLFVFPVCIVDHHHHLAIADGGVASQRNRSEFPLIDCSAMAEAAAAGERWSEREDGAGSVGSRGNQGVSGPGLARLFSPL